MYMCVCVCVCELIVIARFFFNQENGQILIDIARFFLSSSRWFYYWKLQSRSTFGWVVIDQQV